MIQSVCTRTIRRCSFKLGARPEEKWNQPHYNGINICVIANELLSSFVFFFSFYAVW